MNTHTTDTLKRDYVYGSGILVDDLATAEAAGLVLHTLRHAWLTDPGACRATRVICGEIVMAADPEGEPFTTRCAQPVTVWAPGQVGTGCEAHDLGPEHLETCAHGMSKALCNGPSHY